MQSLTIPSLASRGI